MEPFDLREWNGFVAAGGDLSKPCVIDQVVIDSRRISSDNALFIALEGARVNGHQFVGKAKYSLVRLNRKGELKVQDPLHAFQQIAACYRKKLPCKVVGITGSYGKTMVKDLLQLFLECAASPESFNSQIGVALSLFRLKSDDKFALIEAGISEVGEMDRLREMIQPDFGIITHIGKKHIATLGNIETTAREMNKLFSETKGWVYKLSDKSLPHATFDEKATIQFPDGDRFEKQFTTGFSYIADLLNLAIKPAWKLGVSKEKIIEVLEKYSPEPMRTEIWESPSGATFINESYGSDPQSVDIALRRLAQVPPNSRKYFIFGGLRGKNLETEYRRIGEAIDQVAPEQVFIIGEQPASTTTSTTHLQSHSDAYQHLKNTLRRGDTVLIKGKQKESLENLISTFHGSICSNLCTINLAVLESNLATIRKKIPDTRLMVMVKAQGYGTSDTRLAPFLANCGVDILGVSYVDEAARLRESGYNGAIFVLNITPYEIEKAVNLNLEIGVSNKEIITSLAEKGAKVHLHVDTGMSRLGCRPEEAVELAELIRSHPTLKLEGIFTHFASADNPEQDAFTLQQAKQFDQVIGEIEAKGIALPWKHAANSSGMIRFSFNQYNMARIGLSLFGLYPSEDSKKLIDLGLAISLTSRIVGINHCFKGDTVSYGRNYTVEKEEQRIAIIPIGYFDGIKRQASGKGHVLIRGEKASMVGTICMDYMMCDISDIPEATIGDTVLIFGEDDHGNTLSPEQVAAQNGTIPHELISTLGPRIQRIFIHED